MIVSSSSEPRAAKAAESIGAAGPVMTDRFIGFQQAQADAVRHARPSARVRAGDGRQPIAIPEPIVLEYDVL